MGESCHYCRACRIGVGPAAFHSTVSPVSYLNVGHARAIMVGADHGFKKPAIDAGGVTLDPEGAKRVLSRVYLEALS
jgi:hypothetical protein